MRLTYSKSVLAIALAVPLISTSLMASSNKELKSQIANRAGLTEMWPGAEYNASIPTVKQVLGYEIGQRISSHADMVRYFKALEQAAPSRIKVMQYATTWEGRQLIFAAIGKSDYLSDLDGHAQNMQTLSSQNTIQNVKDSLVNKLPASVWLGYSVHGNEISGTDAAMMTAYYLLAAKNNVEQILDNTLVFIDPLQNPDGRTRFTSRYYSTVGLEHSADRLSAEHNEPWPSGRSNHYLFDMNRDWLAATQPETKGRIAEVNKYRPLVVIDLHEMGGDQSYYFAPAAKPFNPNMTQDQVNNMGVIGENIGAHFDTNGFDYFTREIFDAFYPGYGDSWPTFYGASASTFEVSSSRGELFRKRSGEVMTYHNTVRRHFVASIATLEGASKNRNKLLNDYVNYQNSAVKEGKENKSSRFYVFAEKVNRAGAHKLASLMAEHDVTVNLASEDFKMCGKSYSAGTYFIDSAQPKGRFIKTTFEKQVDMADDFIKEQERRRARKLDNEIYDVTGWSLPLMFGVSVDSCGKAPNIKSTAVDKADTLTGKIVNPDAKVGFVIPWGDMSAGRFLTAALREGIAVKSADKAFQMKGGQSFPAGSLIVERRANSSFSHGALTTKITNLAQQTGALVHGVDTSWVIEGPSFGSNNTPTMVAPKIAIAWDSPVSSLSTGHTRFVIERQFNYPVTAIRTSTLAWANLENYHVLILPNGYYHNALGKSGADNLKDWVKKGGVLITMSGATQFAADPDIGLLDVQRELAISKGEPLYPDAEDKKEALVDGVLLTSKKELIEAVENNKEQPDFVAGILANVEVDQEHWLTAGVKPNVVGLAYGNDIFTPIKLASGKNVAWFAGEEDVLASGYLWAENKKQMAYKPFLIHQPLGNGMVISFTQEPTARAYLDGLNVMFMNTIFRAAAHARPLR